MSPSERRPPRWLGYANRINIAMLSRGIGAGTQRLLTIPGRASGIPRTTPIATVRLDGSEYIVAGYANSDWVKNARAAGRGMLSRGKSVQQVNLIELPISDRLPVLREFLRSVRGGRSFLTVGARATDAQLVAASQDHPVFRVSQSHAE